MRYTVPFLVVFAISGCSSAALDQDVPTDISVTETGRYFALAPEEGADAGLIFYPGGRVDPYAYVELCSEYVERTGHAAFIARMPLDLAVLGATVGVDIVDEHPEIARWSAAGHSLGGVMAANLVSENRGTFEALTLLAAYPTEGDELNDWDGQAVVLTGENDDVLNAEAFAEGIERMPDERVTVDFLSEVGTGDFNTFLYEIPGANHAQFGNYGEQNGDGVADISRAEQHTIVVDFLEAIF